MARDKEEGTRQDPGHEIVRRIVRRRLKDLSSEDVREKYRKGLEHDTEALIHALRIIDEEEAALSPPREPKHQETEPVKNPEANAKRANPNPVLAPDPGSAPIPETEPATGLRRVRQELTNFPRSSTIRPHIKTAAQMSVKFKDPPTPIIDHGILHEGGLMILAGETGCGKSTLILNLAIHLIRGKKFYGWYVPQPRRVLIIRDQISWHRQTDIQNAIIAELDLPPDEKAIVEENLYVYIPPEPDSVLSTKLNSAVRDYIQDEKIEVVVWDPVVNFHTAHENNNVTIRQVMARIEGLAKATSSGHILIHQLSKQGEGAKRPSSDYRRSQQMAARMRDAGCIERFIDAAIGMETRPLRASGSSKKDHEVGFKISLYHCKTRYMYWKPPLELERRKDSFVYGLYSGLGHVSPEELETIIQEGGGEIKSERMFIEKIMEMQSMSMSLAKQSIARAVKEKVIEEIPAKIRGTGKKYRLGGKKAA